MNRMTPPDAPGAPGAPGAPDATYRDVLDAPEGMVAELILGRLHTQPRPAKPHGLVSSTLGMDIGTAFQRGRGGPGGWWIIDEPEIHFTSRDVLVPDIAGWRRETLPELGRGAYFTTAPDWVCEVLSPRTREYDLTDKRDIYRAHGVGHLWLVDPDARTLETFALQGGAWMLGPTAHGDAEVAAPPFEALTIALGDLWVDEGS